jgi:hypothetical protein
MLNLRDQPRTPEAIADACEEAAALLEGQWMQGDWYSPPWMDRHGDRHSAAYCVEGALAAVLGMEVATMHQQRGQEMVQFRNCAVYRAVRDTIRERPSYDEYDHLPPWNDAAGRTEQEVLDVLHETAKRVLGVEP